MRLNYQFQLIQAIRDFFNSQGFMDVLTPPMVENPGMEVHIHPFAVKSVNPKNNFSSYLHTSPEFHMKYLLSLSEEKLEKIFTINYCFRDEPSSPIHRNQFLMLEWYRKHARYEAIMQDVEDLIAFCTNRLEKKAKTEIQNSKMQRATVAELFKDIINVDILNLLDKKELKAFIAKDFKDVPLPDVDCDWDDYFFLLFLNKIEPHFTKIPQLLLYEFPAPLAALSTISAKDPRVCERFEVYINGVELCNCFNELTDPIEQKRRFSTQNQDKKRLYGYELPEPKTFYQTMDSGLPPSSGVALGIERLLLSLVEIDNPFYQ